MEELSSAHYFIWLYNSKGRFCSYWHQINEIISLRTRSILEIGIGNGIVSDTLKKMGMNVTTLDIDSKLKPDCIGSVLNIPFHSNTFEAVAAFELMEHLPYSKFGIALKQVYEVSKNYVILSLPEAGKVFRFFMTLPFGLKIRLMIPLPRIKRVLNRNSPEHQWEINERGYPLSRIIEEILSVGFKVQKTYRVFENPYHRFLILSIKDKMNT